MDKGALISESFVRVEFKRSSFAKNTTGTSCAFVSFATFAFCPFLLHYLHPLIMRLCLSLK